MKALVEAIQTSGKTFVVTGREGSFDAAQFLSAAQAHARALQDAGVACLGLDLDNGPEWLILDLATRLADIPLVPLPGFFTSDQKKYVMETAGVDGIISVRGEFPGFLSNRALSDGAWLLQRERQDWRLPAGTAKVTFTSGTTGQPKGVCLSAAALDHVARSITEATAEVTVQRHLCLLPLPVLLENIAGAWVAMLHGAEILAPPLEDLGWSGSSGIDTRRLVQRLRSDRPDTVILLPQVLKALVEELERTGERLESLSFAAVGGARTAPALIKRARVLGLPVYEGYGLSECASVVSLNLPSADIAGSVGRALNPGRIRVGSDGRILLRHPGFLGYAGSSEPVTEWLDSGDLGELDDGGFLHIRGRSKNLLITGYGRNVSPEWVESELLAEEGVLQAVVVGDGWARLGALLVVEPGINPGLAIARCNQRLPDYARLGAWRVVPPMTSAQGLLTPNGRPCRDAIARFHNTQIDCMGRESQSVPAVITAELPSKQGNTHDIL